MIFASSLSRYVFIAALAVTASIQATMAAEQADTVSKYVTSAISQMSAEVLAGDANAQLSLGMMYDVGMGVPQDYAQAAQWFRKAAERGYANAQNDLGVMYVKGQGVPLPTTTMP